MTIAQDGLEVPQGQEGNLVCQVCGESISFNKQLKAQHCDRKMYLVPVGYKLTVLKKKKGEDFVQEETKEVKKK